MDPSHIYLAVPSKMPKPAFTCSFFVCTVNSWFKKDLNLQIHLHKAFFSDNRFLDSVHKFFLNQTTLDLRKEKRSFLNREFTVLSSIDARKCRGPGQQRTNPCQQNKHPAYPFEKKQKNFWCSDLKTIAWEAFVCLPVSRW